jgi:hypothetical protein
MKLNFAGRSGLRVHLSESQLKQLGDLALRAASNSVMPFGEARSCQRRENEKFLVRSSRRGGSLTVIEQDLLKFR